MISSLLNPRCRKLKLSVPVPGRMMKLSQCHPQRHRSHQSLRLTMRTTMAPPEAEVAGTTFVTNSTGPNLVVTDLFITGVITHGDNSHDIQSALQTISLIHVHKLGLYLVKIHELVRISRSVFITWLWLALDCSPSVSVRLFHASLVGWEPSGGTLVQDRNQCEQHGS